MNMRAIVVETPGEPDVLKIKEIPRPAVKPGWVLIEIKAFGLNRAELMTRKGWSGDAVKFPRVIGIECAPHTTLTKQHRVHTLEAQPLQRQPVHRRQVQCVRSEVRTVAALHADTLKVFETLDLDL